MGFKDKVAVVTGSAQGIGEAVARKLAMEGADVVIVDVDIKAAERVASSIDNINNEVLAVKCDVSNEEDVKKLFKQVIDRFGRLDILVNNAGINRDAMLTKMTLENWEKVIAVDLTGVFLCSREASVIMKEQNYGKIVNVSSVAARGNIGQSNYSAAKAGVVGLTKTMAKELGRYNINVNCVQPGFTLTQMTTSLPEKIKEQFIKQIPLGRACEPKEQASVIAFLASDESSYMTGKVLEVDGGLLM